MECYISRLCFRHVLFLLHRRLSASTVHGLNQKYQVHSGECSKNSYYFHVFFVFVFCGLYCLSAPSRPLSCLIFSLCFMPLSDFYIPLISFTPLPISFCSSSLRLCSFLPLSGTIFPLCCFPNPTSSDLCPLCLNPR